MVISTTTRTGQALARERFGENRVFYCPLDLPWAVRAYLNALRPRLLILAETEFWPNLLNGCFRRQIPVAVVNARISDRSWPRYLMLRRLWEPLLAQVSRVLAQSETDAERLKAIGCRPERVTVSGNLKFDVRAAQEAEATKLLKAYVGRVCASSWPAARWRAKRPRCWKRGRSCSKAIRNLRWCWLHGIRSALTRWPHCSKSREILGCGGRTGKQLRTGPTSAQSRQVVLLDTIGELASVYSLAAVAFVGGSLVPAGGHNPLEPAQFGVPIVMGPHYANFRAITEDLRAHDGIRIAAKEDLASALVDLLCDPTAAAAMGGRARQVFDEQAGATERTVRALESCSAKGSRAA